jgi:hypothetical protein
MTATYHITEQDYVNGMRLHQRGTRSVKATYIILVASLAFLTVFGPERVRAMAIGGLVGGVAVMLLFQLLFMPMMARRHYRKYKAIQEPITIELKDEGVEFTTTDSHSVFKWDKILKWRQNEHYILIYPMPQIFFLITKTITNQSFDLAALTDNLTTHVGKEG